MTGHLGLTKLSAVLCLTMASSGYGQSSVPPPTLRLQREATGDAIPPR
jgi:hypothetical protein